MTLILRPLREEEFDAWRERSIARYAADMVGNGGLDEEFSRRKGEEDFARALPQGLGTEGAAVFAVEDEAGTRIGDLWLGEQDFLGRPRAWVYELYVEAEFRGRGHGRAAMELAEQEARRRGHTRIELNVFGGNDAARALYRSLGYTEIAVVMGKDLA